MDKKKLVACLRKLSVLGLREDQALLKCFGDYFAAWLEKEKAEVEDISALDYVLFLDETIEKLSKENKENYPNNRNMRLLICILDKSASNAMESIIKDFFFSKEVVVFLTSIDFFEDLARSTTAVLAEY